MTPQQAYQAACEHHQAARFAQAEAIFRDILRQFPQTPELHNSLGMLLSDCGRLDEAIEAYHRAIELRPDFAAALNNLGNARKDTARVDEAIHCFRQALSITPDLRIADNLLLALNYQDGQTPQSIAAEHAQWNDVFARPFASGIQPHGNDRSPERKLRIGYVSGDFCLHVSSMFTLPLLASHNHDEFEIFCYSNVRTPDELTEFHRQRADQWRDIIAMNDQQAADLIRQDKIDILIDLSLHSAGNRLLLFARKPAPVQVTWLAYPGTTGLATMDWRFSDPYLDSRNGQSAYVEKTICLPSSFWCFDPRIGQPEPSPLPFLTNGYITFGSLNSFAKVSDRSLKLWSGVLREVPNSRILVHAPEGNSRQRVTNTFIQNGTDPNRVEFISKQPRMAYMQTWHRIDIALDTTPCNGATTTLDALWMGVPVISFAGAIPVGRAGLSILSNVGLADCVAQTPDQYVKIAKTMSSDPNRLAALRQNLRAQIHRSPLMDAPRFARDLGNIFRAIWRECCNSN